MNIKELLEVIQTNECGFASKIDNINGYYLVKVNMDENVYRQQSTLNII